MPAVGVSMLELTAPSRTLGSMNKQATARPLTSNTPNEARTEKSNQKHAINELTNPTTEPNRTAKYTIILTYLLPVDA